LTPPKEPLFSASTDVPLAGPACCIAHRYFSNSEEGRAFNRPEEFK